METISIRTTQNVFIEYPIASLGDRMLAFLLDAIILTVYNFLCYFILQKYSASIRVNVLVYSVPFLLYHPVFEILMNGQSPGKKQMRIKVVNVGGSRPTIGSYLMRWLFRLVEFLPCGVPLLWWLSPQMEKGQRLGDMAAGTAVVKLMPQDAASSSAMLAQMEDDHKPMFPQVAQFNNIDLEVIYKALGLNRESGNVNPVNAIANKIKSLLGIETDLVTVKFLHSVIKDHQYFTSEK
jgi:uncharacterized RDD family membrane protein YckC